MKFLALFLMATVFLSGCTKTATGTMNPIQSAGCAVETVVVASAASSVSSILSCSNQSAIAASLTTALGNVNLCATPVASANATAAMIASAKVAPKWSTLGDVTAGDLNGAGSQVSGQAKAQVAKPMGIVGDIACPIVVNTVIGFATSAIPSSWGCTGSASADSVSAALTAACEAAVPL